MKTKLFLFLILSVLSCNLFAYPISPMPLRKLIIESENIVYGEVLDIKSNKKVKEHDWLKSEIVVLKIYDVLHGNIKSGQIIEVYTSSEISCPAPAYYEKGKLTLAFLYKEKKEDRYSTHSLSYGSKTLEKEEYSVYKKRILEMQNILKIKNEEEKHAKTVDWLVECALQKPTKWEGTYELSPESDFMSFYDRDKDTFVRKFELNDNQKEKLRLYFLSQKKLEYSDLGLLDLVAMPNDKELLSFLIGRFKESYNDFIFEGNFFMSRIADLSGRNDLKEISEKNEKLDMFSENYDQKNKEILTEFASKL
ncbi:hypothetical protein [Chryseobacterium gambrini]|uniref:hypothetical protein n=1 Tax=Chryseobacterium gambrini TaxID=373672 RepID=UPI0022F1AB42|nr:hypothetical protein [Chryseobacterium gambrini]WBV54088.1 hypothetical protein PFY09_07100 [Chryseobacterium gambrini]